MVYLYQIHDQRSILLNQIYSAAKKSYIYLINNSTSIKNIYVYSEKINKKLFPFHLYRNHKSEK